MNYILIVSDGKPGHYRQSIAVAEAIRILDKETQIIYQEVSIGKGRKYLLRMLLNMPWLHKYLKRYVSMSCLQWFYKGIRLKKCPKYVVSSGKDTSMLTACLGMICEAQTYFVGHPKKLNHRLFTAVLSVLDLGFDNQIVLETAPSLPYDKASLEEFCKKKGLNLSGKYATLLVGGDGAGYRYDTEDYERMIDFVNATQDSVSWLVTTSRRTPLDIERMMEKRMDVACFISFHRNPEAVVAPFLALSEYAFVTEDSASMVSEAVASGVRVITLVPSSACPDENYRQILKKFEKQKLIQRTPITMLDTNIFQLKNFRRKHTFDALIKKLSFWVKQG